MKALLFVSEDNSSRKAVCIGDSDDNLFESPEPPTPPPVGDPIDYVPRRVHLPPALELLQKHCTNERTQRLANAESSGEDTDDCGSSGSFIAPTPKNAKDWQSSPAKKRKNGEAKSAKKRFDTAALSSSPKSLAAD